MRFYLINLNRADTGLQTIAGEARTMYLRIVRDTRRPGRAGAALHSGGGLGLRYTAGAGRAWTHFTIFHDHKRSFM